MMPEDFIHSYETALGTQDWDEVAPLIHENACVTFSTGGVYKGKAEVRRAFEANFSSIRSEHYAISNVHWVKKGPDTAAYLFDFQWSGYTKGEFAAGSGRGTCFLANENGEWLLLVEHLGPGS